jgi:hypothetical protein
MRNRGAEALVLAKHAATKITEIRKMIDPTTERG